MDDTPDNIPLDDNPDVPNNDDAATERKHSAAPTFALEPQNKLSQPLLLAHAAFLPLLLPFSSSLRQSLPQLSVLPLCHP